MRCTVTNPKTLRKYSRLVGTECVKGITRGSTGHRVDLYTRDGRECSFWPDGTVMWEEDFNDQNWMQDVPKSLYQIWQEWRLRTGLERALDSRKGIEG